MFKKIIFLKNTGNRNEYINRMVIVAVTKSLSQEEFDYLDNLTVLNNVYLFHVKNFKWMYLNNV
ncbi:conserved in LCDV-1, -2 and -3 [Lymphocystis disease virus 4]|uniref:Conserved in LCDV-1,-2 and-3 n=1 Tax=Lymphocystis disease virus 4 TaxID=2704413 RepID=A0A6B9XL83_9VIRU|nr:conserved in LCDV-1, -2 and -3 [Lymphocystis disease virus 4]QHR78569.1 conserved in LCDV-1, -2 and -3 [Lymphocystis disease virus 4]